MAHAPGNLTELGPAALRDYAAVVNRMLAKDRPRQILRAADERTPSTATVDWTGLPVRPGHCLQSRTRSLRLLDWRSRAGDVGRTLFQEEYLEWRVVRDAGGAIQRVEMTTEFPEYWRVLAVHHPDRAVELVREFAREPDVDPKEIFGGIDPHGAGVGPDERRAGFIRAMQADRESPPASAYNNGERAICCMNQGANTLSALVALVLAAGLPYVGEDDGEPLSGSEAIAATPQQAVDCRNSDPTVVGTVVELAANGHLLALDDPIGVYILDVDHASLLTPDGQPVPEEWFIRSRGSRAADDGGGGGLERSQRLVFELPPGLDFGIEQIVDARTDEPILHGGQIADHVRLGVHVRVSPPGAVEVEPLPIRRPKVTPCERNPGCSDFQEGWGRFAAAGEPPPRP